MSPTIEATFKAMMTAVHPNGVSEVQRDEMRNAFYAGYALCFARVRDASVKPQEVAFVELDQLTKEIQEYFPSQA